GTTPDNVVAMYDGKTARRRSLVDLDVTSANRLTQLKSQLQLRDAYIVSTMPYDLEREVQAKMNEQAALEEYRRVLATSTAAPAIAFLVRLTIEVSLPPSPPPSPPMSPGKKAPPNSPNRPPTRPNIPPRP
ncbi:hypothetical protein Agub_g9396, partial [Astrephomene gubernaculifera]